MPMFGGLAILSLRSQELLQSSSVVEAAPDTWGFLWGIPTEIPLVTMGLMTKKWSDLDDLGAAQNIGKLHICFCN